MNHHFRKFNNRIGIFYRGTQVKFGSHFQPGAPFGTNDNRKIGGFGNGCIIRQVLTAGLSVRLQDGPEAKPLRGLSAPQSFARYGGFYGRIGIAAAFGALGQAKGLAAACEAIGRNPGAVGPIRITMIIGLALIESLVIYALIIAFMILA